MSEQSQIENFQACIKELATSITAQSEAVVSDVQAEVAIEQKERQMKVFEYGLLMGDIEKASGKIGDRGSSTLDQSELQKHVAMM